MIEIPLNHLLLIALGGVALGVLITLFLTAKSSPQNATRSAARPSPKPSPKPATNSAPESNRDFLNRCVMQRRSLSIDKVAQMLGVTPRRIRRLLDDGVLIPVATTDGPRRVTAISVHDLLARQKAVKDLIAETPKQPIRVPRKVAKVAVEEPEEEEFEEDEPEEEPPPVRKARKPKPTPLLDEEEESEDESAEEESAEEDEGEEGEEDEGEKRDKSPSGKKVSRNRKGKEDSDDGYDYEGEKDFTPRLGQKYWYYVEGVEHPFRSLRAALKALGLPLAQTAWDELPTRVRAVITRRKV